MADSRRPPRWRFLVALALAAMGAGCASKAPESPARAEIEAANQRLVELFNRGDYRAVAAMYADDAVLLGPRGYRIDGREAIDIYWDRPRQDASWSLEVLDITGTGEMPVQHGRSVLRQQRDGKPLVADAQFVVIWRRQPDGSYRIVVDAYWPNAGP